MALSKYTHLEGHLRLRSHQQKDVLPDDFILPSLSSKLDSQHVRITAAASRKIYVCDDGPSFQQAVCVDTNLSFLVPGVPLVPEKTYLRCSILLNKLHNRLGAVEVHTLRRDPDNGDWLEVDVIFVWKGSDNSMDWLGNFDFNPTATQHDKVKVHSGMFSVWNDSKKAVEKELERIEQEIEIPINRVIFGGHSKAGGVAQVAQFETAYCKDGASVLVKFRERANYVGFAAPPGFHVEDGDLAATEDVRAGVAANGVNLIMEFDLVPQLASHSFRSGALESLAAANLEPYIGKGLSVKFVEKLAPIVKSFAGKSFSSSAQSVMDSCMHFSQLYVRCKSNTSNEVEPSTWKWLKLETQVEKDDFIRRPWPFMEEHVAVATDIALTDHTRMPNALWVDWRTDHCISRNGASCLDLHGTTATPIWHDCGACRQTLCETCHTDKHPKPRREGMRCKHEACAQPLRNFRVLPVPVLGIEECATGESIIWEIANKAWEGAGVHLGMARQPISMVFFMNYWSQAKFANWRAKACEKAFEEAKEQVKKLGEQVGTEQGALDRIPEQRVCALRRWLMWSFGVRTEYDQLSNDEESHRKVIQTLNEKKTAAEIEAKKRQDELQSWKEQKKELSREYLGAMSVSCGLSICWDVYTQHAAGRLSFASVVVTIASKAAGTVGNVAGQYYGQRVGEWLGKMLAGDIGMLMGKQIGQMLGSMIGEAIMKAIAGKAADVATGLSAMEDRQLNQWAPLVQAMKRLGMALDYTDPFTMTAAEVNQAFRSSILRDHPDKVGAQIARMDPPMPEEEVKRKMERACYIMVRHEHDRNVLHAMIENREKEDSLYQQHKEEILNIFRRMRDQYEVSEETAHIQVVRGSGRS